MLCKKPKTSSFKTSARRRAGARGVGASGRRGGCGAVLSAPNKKQGCRRQPCSLSMLDSLKPMQFGFFGSRGLFPKKVPERSARRSLAYIPFPSCWGAGRGAPRIIVSPAGRGAPRKQIPCAAKPRRGNVYQSSRQEYSVLRRRGAVYGS